MPIIGKLLFMVSVLFYRSERNIILVIILSLRRLPWCCARCRAGAELQSLSIADVNLWSLSLSIFLRLLQRNVVSVFEAVFLFALGQIAIEICSFFANEN